MLLCSDDVSLSAHPERHTSAPAVQEVLARASKWLSNSHLGDVEAVKGIVIWHVFFCKIPERELYGKSD